MRLSTRGPLRIAVAALVVAFSPLGLIGPAQSYTVGPTEPWAICLASSQADLSVLEVRLAPPDGTTVQAGTPVTFSGNSSSPVAFAVASSTALLSSPDIDGAPGSEQLEPFSTGPPPVYTYVFTSTKAAATPGTFYRDAFISTAGRPDCEGVPPQTLRTRARALTVLPPPVTAPVGPPPPQESSSLFGAGLTGLGSFHLAHPTIAYSIHCTTSCSGATSSEAFVLRRHAKAIHVPQLDVGPRPVSITTASGSDERFIHHYSGRSLRLLKSLLAKGDVVELQITINVKDASNNVVRGKRTTRLRA